MSTTFVSPHMFCLVTYVSDVLSVDDQVTVLAGEYVSQGAINKVLRTIFDTTSTECQTFAAQTYWRALNGDTELCDQLLQIALMVSIL